MAVKGHRMAKAALETAVLDAQLRARDVPLAGYLGAARDRVPAGSRSASWTPSPSCSTPSRATSTRATCGSSSRSSPAGTSPPSAPCASASATTSLLQVDANAAYTLADAPHLAKLDDFDLLLIEQPLANDDMVGHAELAKL